MRTYCCNPFNLLKHRSKKRRTFLVQKKTKSQARSLNIKFTDNDRLCADCKISINKKSKETTESIQETAAEPIASTSGDGMLDDTQMPLFSLDKETESSDQKTISSENEIVEDDATTSISDLNKTLLNLGESPVAKKKLRTKKYREIKAKQVTTAIKTQLFGCSQDSESESDNECDYGNEVVEILKAKMAEATSNAEKYLVLTTLPLSLSVRRIAREFNVSRFMASRSKELIREKGHMVIPNRKLGSRTIPEHIVRLVQDFYRDDDNSRACPGKNDYVTIRSNNTKEQKQRRLLLFNLTEGYSLFKEKYPNAKVGISTFASLRPPECVLALDRNGTHSVCVCMHHQNVKLLFEPLKQHNMFDETIKTYKDLLAKTLCENPSIDCHLNVCKNCPGTTQLLEYLSSKLEDIRVEDLNLKQWTIVKGTTISKSIFCKG